MDTIKNLIHDPKTWPLVFVAIWLMCFFSNGLKWTSFDLKQLQDFGLFVLGKYLTDSWFNTPKGGI